MQGVTGEDPYRATQTVKELLLLGELVPGLPAGGT